MIFIDDFLTKEECDYFIKFIDSNNQRSAVSGGSEKASTVTEARTSHTSNLPSNDEKVQYLKKKIATYLGQPIEKGEDLQGQVYSPGQYFRPHTDYFDGSDYNQHCLASGNRTYTFMIYLNEDMVGGETNFPKLDMSIKPKTGKAVIWEDMKDGILQPESLHEGSEVKEGKKYIITSWWRENEWQPAKDQELGKAYTDNLTVPTNTFSSIENFPKLTKEGFKVIKCPSDTWELIQDAYSLLKDKPVEENFPGKENFIKGTTEMLSFDNMPAIRKLIHQQLLPLHEEWVNEKLEPTMLYGIRSYNKGATLVNHTDRIETHHVSSIIIVDKDLACGCSKTKAVENDWPLDFQDHEGTWHKVYAEIGDIILYESATCKHGREEEFKGDWYRNFFVHYKLKDWQFKL